MDKLQLEYLKSATAARYDFYLIPKLLIDHEAFDEIDYGAKLLYSLMLNRASLSATNAIDFSDENGNLYIIYTVEQVMENMRCSTKTAVKMLKQLDDIGLIEKKRQGQGKPSIIYVKDFATVQFLNCNKYNSRIVKNTTLEVQNVQCSYNDFSYNDFSQSQSHCQRENMTDRTMTIDMKTGKSKEIFENEKELPETVTTTKSNGLEESSFVNAHQTQDEFSIYLKIIQENIEYNHFLHNRHDDINLVNELVNCILDVICTKGDTVKINGEEKNRNMVKSQYLKLDSMDINHVLDKYKEQRHKIKHLHNYIKTMLYTVKQESDHYYTNSVRADGIV